MEFTKENVEQAWAILNTSSLPEEKKMADNFLLQFKKSPNALEISEQLLNNTDENSQILGAFVIYQNIKERITEIIESQEEFFKYRNLIINSIAEKIKSSSPLIQERICYSITILLLVGVITYWTDAVEEILQFGKLSKENCFLTTIVLGNVNQELWELKISQRTQYRIRDVMIFKKDLIKDFIFLLLNNIGPSSDGTNTNLRLFTKVVDLARSWIKLDLNVLKIPLLSQTLMANITGENIVSIADVFSESLDSAGSSKIYTDIQTQDINELVQRANQDELQSVYYLIEIIKSIIVKLKLSINRSEDDNEILVGIANIFASICENFVYLFFVKDSTSSTLMELLFYFISHHKRIFSFKMFETLREIKDFISKDYKFLNYTDTEKLQFCQYLMTITEQIMLKCKLKFLNVNYDALAKKNTLLIDKIDLLQMTTEDENDIELNANEVSLSEYRKNAEDVFYFIFLIFTQNFGSEGESFFIGQLNQLLISADINSDSIVNDSDRLLGIETVLLVVRSLVDTVEMTEGSVTGILELTKMIFNSKLLSNDKIVVNFLLFLDRAAPYLWKSPELYMATSQLLLNVSKSKLLERISSAIFLWVTENTREVNLSVFNAVYEFYLAHYDTLSSATVSNLSEALCHVVGIFDTDLNKLIGLSSEDLVPYFTAVIKPASERLAQAYQYLTSSSKIADTEYNTIKLELLKDYQVHYNVLKQAFFLNNDLLALIFSVHMKETAHITQEIYKLFVNDAFLINEITKTYLKVVHHLGPLFLDYFDMFNTLMLYAYLNNYENYSCLSLFLVLYSETIKNSQEKLAYVGNNFLSLCNQINQNVVSMKKHQIEVVDIYAQLFTRVLSNLTFINLNDNNNIQILFNSIQLFIDALVAIIEGLLNRNIIVAFTKIITSTHLIPKEILNLKFPDIVHAVFASCDHFDSPTISEFVHFVSYGLKFNDTLFISSVKSTLAGNKFHMFKQQHVNIIAQYIMIFGKSEKHLKGFLGEIIHITKGIGQVEALKFYEIEIAKHKFEKK